MLVKEYLCNKNPYIYFFNTGIMSITLILFTIVLIPISCINKNYTCLLACSHFIVYMFLNSIVWKYIKDKKNGILTVNCFLKIQVFLDTTFFFCVLQLFFLFFYKWNLVGLGSDKSLWFVLLIWELLIFKLLRNYIRH